MILHSPVSASMGFHDMLQSNQIGQKQQWWCQSQWAHTVHLWNFQQQERCRSPRWVYPILQQPIGQHLWSAEGEKCHQLFSLTIKQGCDKICKGTESALSQALIVPEIAVFIEAMMYFECSPTVVSLMVQYLWLNSCFNIATTQAWLSKTWGCLRMLDLSGRNITCLSYTKELTFQCYIKWIIFNERVWKSYFKKFNPSIHNASAKTINNISCFVVFWMPVWHLNHIHIQNILKLYGVYSNLLLV